MFSVLDANGCIKAATGGPGAGLTDPLTVAHGGTGNAGVYPKGGIVYANTTTTYSDRVPDFDNGIPTSKLLTNLAYPGDTTASDVRLGTAPRWSAERFVGQFVPAQLSAPATYTSQGSRMGFIEMWAGSGTDLSSSTTGINNTGIAGTAITDATSTWLRVTTGAAGATAGTGWQTAGYTWNPATWLPYAEVYFRTGASVAGCNIWFVLANTASRIASSNDGSALTLCGVRFSTTAGDTGWQVVNCTGTGVAAVGQLDTVSASTTYKISIGPGYTGPNDVIVTVTSGSGVSSLHIPNGFSGLELGASGTQATYQLTVNNSSGAGTKSIDISAAFVGQTGYVPAYV